MFFRAEPKRCFRAMTTSKAPTSALATKKLRYPNPDCIVLPGSHAKGEAIGCRGFGVSGFWEAVYQSDRQTVQPSDRLTITSTLRHYSSFIRHHSSATRSSISERHFPFARYGTKR